MMMSLRDGREERMSLVLRVRVRVRVRVRRGDGRLLKAFRLRQRR